MLEQTALPLAKGERQPDANEELDPAKVGPVFYWGGGEKGGKIKTTEF